MHHAHCCCKQLNAHIQGEPTRTSICHCFCESEPDLIAIPVGSLGDPGFMPPQASFYEVRKHAWVDVPSTTRRFY